jgi:uncharacterized protein YeaO (DUF488 family)
MRVIRLKRVYEEAASGDGKRFLVERLWPRGLRKADLTMEAWLKEAGPTTELRKWFDHDAEKWEEFRRKYASELDRRPEVWEPILKAARRGGVTLLYSSHDQVHNNAAALKAYLDAKLTGKRVRAGPEQASR